MGKRPHIYAYRTYLKQRYGEILHRVPLDVGFTCPHRLQDGSGGCTFCPEDGARAVQLGDLAELGAQIQAGVSFARRRYGATAFMAYLQAFTSTFGSTTHLRHLVSEILSKHDFRAISFGTRPDCLSPGSLTFLHELQQEIDVWVDLGVQTMQDRTLRRINRGHDSKTSRDAIVRLHQAGIKTAVHLIIGLPGETPADYCDTMSQLAPLPIDGIKIHNLHIIKNTRLAEEYAHQPFPLPDEHQYCEILLQLLPLIPPDRPIIRLTTDTEDDLLIAPRWHMDKGRFRKYLADQLRRRQIFQGMALTAPARSDSLPHVPVVTDDGSITFWNPEVKEHYHSPAGARSEALYKYVLPSNLPARLGDKRPIRILDICFGLGYNSLVSLDLALGQQTCLDIIGLEIDQRVVDAAARQLQEKNTNFDWNDCLHQVATGDRWQLENCSLHVLWGDARHTSRTLTGNFDCIWLDGFSTQRNSELWTVDFFRALYPLLNEHGAVYTYCAAIPVRSGFRDAGFFVGETEPFGRQRGGTVASRDPESITMPLPERDLFLMTTSRGIPYRDPDGTRSNKEILRARQEEILLFNTRP